MEDILLDTVVLANFEYYSASARRFQVLGSNSYPCEHWALLGEFETNNTRQEQVFEIPNPMWVRYLKFRFLTVHGTSHYWSLSLVRAHGQTHIDKFKSDNSRLEEVKNGIRSDMAEAFGAEGEEGAGGGEEGEEAGEGASDDANEGQGEGQGEQHGEGAGEGAGAAEAGEVEDSAEGAATEAAPAAADGEAPSANGAVDPVESGETGAATAADGTAPDEPAGNQEALQVGEQPSTSDTPGDSLDRVEADLAAVPSEECVGSDAGLEEGIEPSQVEAATDPTEVPADGSAVEADGEAAGGSVRPPTEALGDGGATNETDVKPVQPPLAAAANATRGTLGGAEGQARAESPQRGAAADSPTEEPGATAPLAALADAALAAAAVARTEPASSESEAARSTAAAEPEPPAEPELAVPPPRAAEPAETPGQAARGDAPSARESAPTQSSETRATEREPSANLSSTGWTASTDSTLGRADASHHAHPVAPAGTEQRTEQPAEHGAEHGAEPKELADAASDEGCAAEAVTVPSGEAGSSTPSSPDEKAKPEAAPGSGVQNATEEGIVSRTARAVACALGGCQPPPVTPTKGPLETSPPPPPPPPLADPPSALPTPPPPPMPALGTFPSPPLPSPNHPPRPISSSASVVAPPPSPPGRPAQAAAESHTLRTRPSDNGPRPETHREPSPAVSTAPSPESTPAPEPLPVPRADLGVPAVLPTPLPEPASSSVVSASDSPAPTASTEDAGGSAAAPEPTGQQQQQQQQLIEPSATPKASASVPAAAQQADGKPNEASREALSGASALVAAESDSPSSLREARAPVANGSATGAATSADGGAEGETRGSESALFIGPISPGAVVVVAKGAAAAPAVAAPNMPLPPSQAAALRAANDPNNIFSALTKRMGTLEINQTLINTWISLWEGQISAKLKNLSAMQNATHTKLRSVQANVSTTQERMSNLTSSLGIERIEQVARENAEVRPPPPPR